jgi:hypothetical protein
VIGGEDVMIYPTNMEAIMKCPILTNFTKFRSFVGASQYLWNFIASVSAVTTPLHAITVSGNSFQWGKNHHKDFDGMKIKIDQAPILALPNLQNPFEVETNAIGYAMGSVLMQGGRHVYYHSKIFHGGVLNYRTCDKNSMPWFNLSRSGSTI